MSGSSLISSMWRQSEGCSGGVCLHDDLWQFFTSNVSEVSSVPGTIVYKCLHLPSAPGSRASRVVTAGHLPWRRRLCVTHRTVFSVHKCAHINSRTPYSCTLGSQIKRPELQYRDSHDHTGKHSMKLGTDSMGLLIHIKLDPKYLKVHYKCGLCTHRVLSCGAPCVRWQNHFRDRKSPSVTPQTVCHAQASWEVMGASALSSRRWGCLEHSWK